ncbi:MAG: type II 3-dehydroquinate dehydratase [Dehalococcoidia bacterium]
MTQSAGPAPLTILLVHGPNLNLLGERNPAVYGHTTLLDIESTVAAAANARGASVISYQSNHEGGLVDFFHEHRRLASGAIMNAGALTHTSVALRDAIEAVGLPVVEVHLSNIHAREPFRHVSLTAGVCLGVVTGLGPGGYTAAVDLLLDSIERARAAAAT